MKIEMMKGWCMVILLVGCAAISQETLTVLPGAHVAYLCNGGERIVATYYSLSDRSLDFVKVSLPGGREVTLPQALSASGARYTNDVEWVWWTKGDSAFAEIRDPSGEWRIKYQNCRQTAETQIGSGTRRP